MYKRQVSNYFLQLLGWDDLDEFMKASDGSMLSVVCNEQKHIFSPAGLHDLQGSHTLYLTDSKGLSIPVRIVKADARDNKGRPIWVLSVRSDHFARNQEAREAVFHRAFTDMNLCEYYVDLQENTFESMKAVSYTHLDVYKRQGVEKWVTGVWRAKTPLTSKYAAHMQEAGKKVKISFCKIAAHTGNHYNEAVSYTHL